MDEYDSNCLRIHDLSVSWDDQQVLKKKSGVPSLNNDDMYEGKSETNFDTVKNEMYSRTSYHFNCK